MPNVLIRDVPAEDLEQLRAAAAASGESLQARLLAGVRAQATALRRQAALERIDTRLRGRAAVPDTERNAVLDAIDAAHTLRADELSSGFATTPNGSDR